MVSSPSANASDCGVIVKFVGAIPTLCPGPIITCTELGIVVKSPDAPNVAVPAATVTVTLASAVTARVAVAITRTVCAPPSSDNSVTAAGEAAPPSKLNVMSSPSSSINKLSVSTRKGTVVPVAVPSNRISSSPSTMASSTGVIVNGAEYPTVCPLLIVTVTGFVEIE